jgi:hypothetical protein
MIRIEGSAKQAEQLEEKIKQKTVYLSIPFYSTRHDGGKSGNPLESARNFPNARKADESERDYTITGIKKSSCFTRDYEIIAAADKVKQVSDSGQKRVRDMLLWLTYKPMQITFRYDYRVDKCTIVVSYDSWQRLVKILPGLRNDIRIVEANRCEIVCETA